MVYLSQDKGRELVNMTKRIKLVEELAEKAIENRGEFSRNRNGIEVYRASCIDNVFKLYHYSTLTIQYDIVTEELVDLYGESVSDADSIGTVISMFNGLKGIQVGYKPVNGGFYARNYHNGEEVYLDNYKHTDYFAKAVNDIR